MTVKENAGNVAGRPASIPRRAGNHVWRRIRSITLQLLATLLFVSIATILQLLLDAGLALNLIPIIYLIPVVVAATRWGFWPAAFAAIAGAAAADFFFFSPYYSLGIDDPQEVVDLLLFLFVAFICSNLASNVRREADALRRSEQHIQGLYEFTRQLALCFTVRELVVAIHNYVATALGQRAAFVASSRDDDVGSLDGATIPDDIKREMALMIESNDLRTRRSFDEVTQTFWLLKAVSSGTINHGVIAVDVGNSADGTTDQKMRQVEAVIEEAALTLERIDVGKAMAEARVRLQADTLKDALHGIVSHELRTPLASILGAASVLNSTPAVRDNRTIHSLVDGIHDEAIQLDGFLQNLVNASRVTAEGVRPRLEWSDPADIVNAAIKRRARRLSQHRVQVEFADDLPLIRTDSVLVEEACGQLLDNAAKYSPAGSVIAVIVRWESTRVVFSVLDEGVGLTPEEKGQLGRKSFRGQRHLNAIPGFGLGVWIASAFVKANGGTLEITSRGQGPGTIASISLPVTQKTAPGLATAPHE
jgi:two-component system, OmpR family, sensor histidine kinase KdpD